MKNASFFIFINEKCMILKNKTAIVTGASKGLGKAIATVLTQKEVKVFGLARNEKALQEIQRELGDKFIPVKMDLTDEKALSAWVENTFTVETAPNILINNAGIGSFHKIDELSAKDWLDMVNINLNGMYFITSKVAALMKKKKDFSHIINIGSILGTMGREDGAAYCTTKFGVNGFSDSLFKELRRFNIKVTCFNFLDSWFEHVFGRQNVVQFFFRQQLMF